MPELEIYKPETLADPDEPATIGGPFQPTSDYNILNLQWSRPGHKWLYEHRRLDMKPYLDNTPHGPIVRSGLHTLYPGVSDKIKRAEDAGYTEGQITENIAGMVERALQARYSDAQIEENLYRAKKNYGFWDRPLDSFLYGRPENALEKMWDYVGTTPDFKTSPIRHELRAVVERGMSSFTGGLTDALQNEVAMPRTIPGTIGGSVASLVGWIYGPMKMSKGIIGGRLAPTATGLRGMAQLMTQGCATLGLAGGLSRMIPAFTENENFTDAAVDVIENTATMGLIGTLYPMAGAIPSKPLRLAVGMAVMDKIRAGRGQWFTVDDVIKGVADGTVNREELAERSFGYLLDLYFLNRVKPMREQLAGLEKNAMIRRMLALSPDETEQIIIQIRRANLIPKSPERFLDGVGKPDKIRAFGSEKEFTATYKMLIGEQAKLAQKIQADIAGKTTMRIPKELGGLAAKARTFTKAVNFANSAKGKLSATERKALAGIGKKPEPTKVTGKTYYHGTSKEEAAKIEREGFKPTQPKKPPIPNSLVGIKGIYLTPSKFVANEFAKLVGPGKGKVVQAVVNLKKPFVIENLTSKVIDEIERKYVWSKVKQASQQKRSQLVKEGLKAEGYDGIIIKKWQEHGVREPQTIAFDSSSVELVSAKPTIADAADLKAFWQGVQQRDYLEKQSMIQNKSQAEKILDGIKTEIMFNKADAELQRLNQGKIRKNYQRAARALWDTSANVKKDLLKQGGALGKEAVIRHDLIRGAGPKAARMIQQASDRIYSGLSKTDEIILNRIIQSRRTIAVDKYRPDMKHPGGLGLKEHQAYLDGIPKDTFMRLSQRADLYFAEMDSQLGQLYKAGIISRDSYAKLLERGDYSPRQFIQHLDPERTYTFGGRKITVWDSGIKALDEGSYRVLENNSRALLGQVVTRTQARLFRNEANRALYELAKQLPDNGVVQLSKITKVTKKGKKVYQKPPAGYERLGVMIDGQMVEMLMPSVVAKEWVTQDPAVSSQFANIIGWVSGAKLLRPMATGLNPEFALTNLPRDIAHAWITTYEYSPHMPITALQMAKDYVKVLPDTIMRRGAWHDYINEGGGMSFLTHQGRLTRKGTGKLSTLQNVLGYLGETSEIWTRLALRERALRNGKPPHEATYIARNYLDFSQGGWLIKGADTAVPYLNAGVQGTRGIFRAAKEKPGTFTYKMAEIGTLATGLYLANKHSNPECWDSISAHDKANYFIVTTPLTYVDEEGNTRHLYFRVAKDQGQKITCTLFENMMAKYLGEDIDVDQVADAAQEFITIAPTDIIPPTMDAMLGYWSNKDFWRNEEIWKGPEITPQEEYRAYTHPAFVKLGEVTGMSPERARYALQQYFTYGNIYTSLTGGGLRMIMDKLPEDVRDQTTQDMLRQAPFLRRVLKATDPYTQYQKDVEKAKIDEATRRYIQTRKLDALSEQQQADEITQDQVRAFIRQQPWQDRERLVQRHQQYGRLYEIPDKRWWLNLMDLPPQARATAYWTRWQRAEDAERTRLEQYLRKVPGVKSAEFMVRLNQLKKKK